MVATGVLLGIGAMAGFGIADLFHKKSVDINGPALNMFWLQILGTLPIAFLLFIFPPTGSIAQDNIVPILLTVLIGLAGFLSFMQGLSKGKLSIVSPVTATYPILGVALALLFLGETITQLQATAIFLLIIGSISISIQKDGNKIKKSDSGIWYAFAASIGFGISLFFFSIAVAAVGAITMVLLNRVINVVIMSGYFGAKKHIPKISKRGLKMVSIASVFDNTAFVLLSLSFASTFASVAIPISAAFPSVAVILAAIFLRERLRKYQYAAIALIIFGLILIAL